MTASSDSIVRMDHVTVRFAKNLAVDDLSFDLRKGEIVALLGRTGSGKSTALNVIMGALKPDAGGATVMGVDPYRDFRKLKGKVAVSFQNDRLLPWLTANENARLGLLINGHARSAATSIAAGWLGRVGLDDAQGLYPHEMSGGMRQRVSLARALAIDPALLILDESFSQLDHVTSETLRRDFARVIREEAKTCVFVTHRVEDALDVADRILVLATPAKIRLELEMSEADRADETRVLHCRDLIVSALGERAQPRQGGREPNGVLKV